MLTLGLCQLRERAVGVLLFLSAWRRGASPHPWYPSSFRPYTSSVPSGRSRSVRRLRRREQPCIKGGHALVFFHHLLALVQDTHDGIAGLGLGGLVDRGEHLPKAFDLPSGSGVVLLKSRIKLCRLRRLSHLRVGQKNLLLREVDVFKRIEEKVFEIFSLAYKFLHRVKLVGTKPACSSVVPKRDGRAPDASPAASSREASAVA